MEATRSGAAAQTRRIIMGRREHSEAGSLTLERCSDEVQLQVLHISFVRSAREVKGRSPRSSAGSCDGPKGIGLALSRGSRGMVRFIASSRLGGVRVPPRQSHHRCDSVWRAQTVKECKLKEKRDELARTTNTSDRRIE